MGSDIAKPCIRSRSLIADTRLRLGPRPSIALPGSAVSRRVGHVVKQHEPSVEHARRGRLKFRSGSPANAGSVAIVDACFMADLPMG